MVRESIEYLQQFDPEVAGLIGKELSRQRGNLELIASENLVSPAVMAAMGSVLTNKYAARSGSSAQNTPTFRPTAARRRISRRTWRCASPATPCSAWI